MGREQVSHLSLCRLAEVGSSRPRPVPLTVTGDISQESRAPPTLTPAATEALLWLGQEPTKCCSFVLMVTGTPLTVTLHLLCGATVTVPSKFMKEACLSEILRQEFDAVTEQIGAAWVAQ